MTEQQYRVIADRDKGDEPNWPLIQPGDRYVMERETNGVSRIVRIERPVPTTNAPVQYDGSNGLAVFADAARRLSEGRPDPSPHPPTREPIAKAIEVADAEWMEVAHPGATDRDWRLYLTDAVLRLLQNEAER